jgi:hypothetical protein
MIEWNFSFSILCVDLALVRSVDGFGAHQIVNYPARNGDGIHIPCLWS